MAKAGCSTLCPTSGLRRRLRHNRARRQLAPPTSCLGLMTILGNPSGLEGWWKGWWKGKGADFRAFGKVGMVRDMLFRRRRHKRAGANVRAILLTFPTFPTFPNF